MIKPKIPDNEAERLKALEEYLILDTIPEDDYDELTKLASEICQTPISLVSLVDSTRQWFKSHHGLDATETPKEVAFCAHAINEPKQVFIINDSRKDERFFDNPLVTDKPEVIFYAGVPLVNPDGYPLGTLCAIDNVPRELSEMQIEALKIIASQVIKLFELRKRNIILNTMSQDLEQKNSDIKESIQYAKKIQDSTLPDLNDIHKSIPQLVLYYSPKDIIGGDSYWYHKKKNISYLAVIDCTGHGVPGALISIAISGLLNEIVTENKKKVPGEILECLHGKLYNRLKQEKGDVSSQDGCDISLCMIDHETNELQYAGAHQNLYIITQSEIEIIKATRKSIGGLSLAGLPDPIREFPTHTIVLKNDCWFAMTTDGVLDQLNENDYNFGIKRFKQLLSSIGKLTVPDAKQEIYTAIKTWKEKTPQLDDMLMVAFKID